MRITKEKVNKNFTQIQNSIILSTELTDKEKLLHMYYKMRENAEGYCWPGNKRVAADLGWGVSTVRSVKAKLVKVGLIDVRRRYDESIGPLTSRIDLRNMVDEDAVTTTAPVIHTDEPSQLPDTHPGLADEQRVCPEMIPYNNTQENNITEATKTNEAKAPDSPTPNFKDDESRSIYDSILAYNADELDVDTSSWSPNKEDVERCDEMSAMYGYNVFIDLLPKLMRNMRKDYVSVSYVWRSLVKN